MTCEKEIPAYAMQPARAPKIIQSPAVYHKSQMTIPLERQCVTYQFEEDILVPDIKEDMTDILLMEAECDMMPMEKNLIPKTDDLLNFTGTIMIQTLYRSDKKDSLPVAITSKVPYKYQWNLHCQAPAEGYFRCNVKQLEYMIINERKFRVKVTLEFAAYLYEKKELSFFQSLEDTALEMKTEEVTLSGLTARVKEETTVDVMVEILEQKELPVEILWQDYKVTENYRQVTTEKIVLNGFVYVELLYLGRNEEQEEALFHRTERVEFNQFIPLGKELRGRTWSIVKTDMENMGLHTVIEKREDSTVCFHLAGTLRCSISLFEEQTKEMVVDAYHLEKEFTCNFEHQTYKNAVFSRSTELQIRDVVHLPEGTKAESAVFCRCRPLHWKAQLEKNRIVLGGSLQAVSLWKDAAGIHGATSQHGFQQTVETEGLEPDMHVELDLFVRDCRLTYLNERQMELCCSLVVSCDGYCDKHFILLEEPAFVEGGKLPRDAMVITAVEENESLWALAKRHRTTCQRIQDVNYLEHEPKQGQKLLIIR